MNPHIKTIEQELRDLLAHLRKEMDRERKIVRTLICIWVAIVIVALIKYMS
jgi:hypothetical protein